MSAAQHATTIDALVAGAGPVGLTMAAELARHGLKCRLIDKVAAPSDKSKALVLWSRSVEMLDAMGAAQPFVDAGLHGRGASIYSGGERLLHVSLEIDSPFGYALLIPQNDTERLLAEHAARLGIRAERQVELVGFSTSATGVTSTLRHADGREEKLEMPWLIGCDGAHSTVRHVLGVPFAGEAEPNDWMLADMHIDGNLATDELTIFFHKQGVLAFFPIVGGRFRLIADLGMAKTIDHPADPTLADVQRTLNERGQGQLTARDPVWLAGFRIHERMVSEYRHGRTFLVGDAAHIHSPAGGQGMNTGMQDAYNLAWKLALVHRGRAKDTLLDSYSQERSAIGKEVLRNAGIMTKAATLRNPLAQGFRDGMYKLFGSLQVVQHGISNALSEMSINYRHGPLTGEHGNLWTTVTHLFDGGVKAGDRAPDASLVERASGKSIQLFDLFRDTRHVLLLLTGLEESALPDELESIQAKVETRFADLIACYFISPGAGPDTVRQAAADAALVDPNSEMHKRYGAGTRSFYLIRPDGYVGFRSQPPDGDALLAHLQSYLN